MTPSFHCPALMSLRVLAFPVSGKAQTTWAMLKYAVNYAQKYRSFKTWRCWSLRKVYCQAYQIHPFNFSSKLSWIQAKQTWLKQHSIELDRWGANRNREIYRLPCGETSQCCSSAAPNHHIVCSIAPFTSRQKLWHFKPQIQILVFQFVWHLYLLWNYCLDRLLYLSYTRCMIDLKCPRN